MSNDSLISHNMAVDDIRSLIKTIESVHPDPYLNAGGKIAFHRKIYEAIKSIPEEGISRDELYNIVAPIAAAIEDGHTKVFDPHINDPLSPGGIPLYFETAYEGLIVAAVLNEQHRRFLGARLISVEDIPVDTLVDRLSELTGFNNRFQLYRNLGTMGTLWNRHSLKQVLPEWITYDKITIELKMPDNSIIRKSIEIPEKIDYSSFIIAATTAPELLNQYFINTQKSDIFYYYLDSTRQTAVLTIRGLSTYREAFEAWRSLGVTNRVKQARALYQRYNGTPPPEDPDKVIDGLPSATEILQTLAREMKQAGTANLFIDVSQNDGGSSLMSNILVYFLYGRDKLLSLKGHTSEIIKYSREYFEIYPSPNLREINTDLPYALLENEYDFSADYSFLGYPGKDVIRQELDKVISWMPTFAEEYRSGTYENYYRPENVFVLCDAGTYSAAYWVMYYLKQAGAEIVGIPSAQSGNCFGDILEFTLPYSGIKYTVSRKYFEMFPNDPEKGRVLMPDHLMTYQILKDYDFDPFSLIWFASDLAKKDI